MLFRSVWNKVKRKRKSVIVIEGFRSPKQLKMLEQLSGQKPVIIAITAPFRVRHAREHARGRFGKKESEEYLRKRDKLELSHGEGRIIRMADYKINNSGSKEDLEKAVVKLMETLLYSEK